MIDSYQISYIFTPLFRIRELYFTQHEERLVLLITLMFFTVPTHKEKLNYQKGKVLKPGISTSSI